jgi:beta-galactosidase/beta-glucuronidase
MKGINRHVWWPETGRAVTENIDLMDVQLIKEMNMNAVRCSHYPPNKSFLKICDSLGLYVLDELAGWQKIQHRSREKARERNGYERCKSSVHNFLEQWK